MVTCNRLSNPLLYRFLDSCIDRFRSITISKYLIKRICEEYVLDYIEKGCVDDIRDNNLCVVDHIELRKEILNLLNTTRIFKYLVEKYKPDLEKIDSDPQGFGIDDKIYVLLWVKFENPTDTITENEDYEVELDPGVHPVQLEIEKMEKNPNPLFKGRR